MVGADGAMYALRRELFRPCPNDTIIEDFMIPMGVVRQGKRVVHEPEAVGWEKGPASRSEEFRRKVRIAAGSAQGLMRGNAWPPAHAPLRFWFIFLSHKLLRWLSPVVGVAVLVFALLAMQQTESRLVLAGFGAVSGLALIQLLTGWENPVVSAPFYFLFGQTALGWGLLKGLWDSKAFCGQRKIADPVRIIYHHRTRFTDAQRIHILEMVHAFEELGHQVRIVSLVPTDRRSTMRIGTRAILYGRDWCAGSRLPMRWCNSDTTRSAFRCCSRRCCGERPTSSTSVIRCSISPGWRWPGCAACRSCWK